MTRQQEEDVLDKCIELITKVAGRRISSPNGLTNVLLGYAPNAKVTLEWVDYSGSTRRATVTLAVGPPR